MEKKETERFNELYENHLRLLKLQGKSQSTIDSYSRAVRRVSEHFDCCPDQLTPDQLERYFADLVDSHSWSTVKLDRLGLQFFWKHVLKTDWQWINIIKPPKVKTLPDILTVNEIERIIGATRKLRYRVFLLTTYSMGLRLEEALSLQTSDIDAERKKVHIRRGKGHKDRFVPLPDLALEALRELWSKHKISGTSINKPFYLGKDSSIIDSTSNSSIVLEGCNVSGSKLNGSLIMKNCKVESSVLINSILGSGCEVCSGSIIEDSVLGDGTNVTAGTKIINNEVKK